MENNRTLECALYYISQGWAVLPLYTIGKNKRCSCGKKDCKSPGKHPYAPYAPNGVKDATTDKDTIERWFDGETKLNIGVCAGAASGLVLLDIDPQHGGNESIKKYSVPKTVEVITGGGGTHYYFKHPGLHVDVRNSAGALGPGLDVRGHHGYVVAPPSVHITGKQYRWKIDPRAIEIADCPEWIYKTTKRPQTVDVDESTPINEGQRDNTLTSLAGTMRRRGLGIEAIYAALSKVNEKRCKPPLEDKDLKRIATSAGKWKPGESNPTKKLQHRVLSTVEPKEVEYLQPEVIPLGMITSLVSQEGVGKSTLASSIIAHVTRGESWPNAPDIPNSKGHVIIFSHEEDMACILVPRLKANGADLSRVIACEYIKPSSGGNEECPFNIQRNIPELDSLVEKYTETRLVVFDPITSYVSCNENSNSEVRKALKPIVDFAARRNIAVLGLTHLNKKIDLGMINRTIGSRAWSAVPRMVWGIRTEQIEDEEGNKTDTENRFLLNIKCNIGPKPKGLKFSIGEGGLVTWDTERVNLSIDGNCGIKANRIDDAVDWLRQYLEGNKWISSTTIFEDGKEQGFTKSILYKAKYKLKIKASKLGYGEAGQWLWELPNE